MPSDPLRREWVENADANLDRIEELKPGLVSFLAFNRGREAQFAGTGFIIAGDQYGALALTAKHVLEEGVARIQKPENAALAANHFSLPRYRELSLDPRHLKAVWKGASSFDMLNVVHVNYFDDVDLAICVLTPQQINPPIQFTPLSIPICLTQPTLGSEVALVAYRRLEVREMAPPDGPDGARQVLQVESSISLRMGTVTGVHPNGFRQYRWPCFTTSIPAEPGMSGGFAFLLVDGITVSACGIVSADNSAEEARTDFYQTGESVFVLSWPALGFQLPDAIPIQPETRMRTLLDRMLDGTVTRAVGDLARVRVEELQDGRVEVSYR